MTYYQYDIVTFDENNQTGVKPYENYFKTERKSKYTFYFKLVAVYTWCRDSIVPFIALVSNISLPLLLNKGNLSKLHLSATHNRKCFFCSKTVRVNINISLFLDSCKLGFFRCTDSDQCIYSNRTCNGIQDCGDGSDERIDAGCCKFIL